MGRIHEIGRPQHKLGYFEVTYSREGALKTCCLAAHGFQNAIDKFEATGVGRYLSVKEIPESGYEAWFEVSLMSAQNLAQLRTGAHL